MYKSTCVNLFRVFKCPLNGNKYQVISHGLAHIVSIRGLTRVTLPVEHVGRALCLVTLHDTSLKSNLKETLNCVLAMNFCHFQYTKYYVLLWFPENKYLLVLFCVHLVETVHLATYMLAYCVSDFFLHQCQCYFCTKVHVWATLDELFCQQFLLW